MKIPILNTGPCPAHPEASLPPEPGPLPSALGGPTQAVPFLPLPASSLVPCRPSSRSHPAGAAPPGPDGSLLSLVTAASLGITGLVPFSHLQAGSPSGWGGRSLTSGDSYGLKAAPSPPVAANSFATSLQHSCICNSQLLQAGTSQLQHTAG
uniref:Uncharacterized protein n=1 Tax=Mustela putorius furo TaxID=9669 RepID=M3XXC4_MUSPF